MFRLCQSGKALNLRYLHVLECQQCSVRRKEEVEITNADYYVVSSLNYVSQHLFGVCQ